MPAEHVSGVMYWKWSDLAKCTMGIFFYKVGVPPYLLYRFSSVQHTPWVLFWSVPKLDSICVLCTCSFLLKAMCCELRNPADNVHVKEKEEVIQFFQLVMCNYFIYHVFIHVWLSGSKNLGQVNIDLNLESSCAAFSSKNKEPVIIWSSQVKFHTHVLSLNHLC